MICSSCMAYNNNERTFCKSCGVRLEENGGAQQAKKPKYYCKRCRRHLISKICPMHGMEHMVSIDTPEPVEASAGSGWEKATNSNGVRATPLPPPHQHRSLIDTLTEETPRPVANGSATPKTVIAREPEESNNASTPAPQSATQDESSSNESIINDDLQSTLRSLIENRLESLRKERAPQPETQPAQPKRKPAPATAAPKTNGTVKKSGAPKTRTNGTPKSPPKTRLTNATGKVTPSTSQKRTHRKRRRLSPVQLAAAVLIPVFVVAVSVFLYAFFQPVNNAATVFSRAEQAFSEGHYSAASQLYLELQTQYPNDPLAEAATQRISEISTRQAEEMKRRDQVLQLMSGATAAFSKNQFLAPPGENALHYINQILQIDPNFQPAQKMRDEIITHYFDSARQAFESEDYEQAARYYQDILKITPDDPKVLNEMETALKAHSVQKMLDDLSKLANTQQELKQLQKEKYRLKTEVKAEQRKLSKSNTPKTASLTKNQPRKGLLKPSTGTRKPRKILTKSTKTPETIKPASLAKADPNAPLVEEDRIDGKKRYLRQPAPIIPDGLKGKSSGIILAECLVNTLGEVESVTIVSPSQESGFNRLAEQVLKQYRYKPATFRSKPTRFKAVEVLSF